MGGTPLSEGTPPVVDDNTKLIIYGAGRVGKIIVKFLLKENIKNFFVAVTHRDLDNETIEGVPVYEIGDLTELNKNSVVLVTAQPRHHAEIRKTLDRLGFYQIRYLK